MVVGWTLNSQARPCAICAGERPRATSERMCAIACSKSHSFLPTPLRASDRSSTASAWARAAEYSSRRALPQPWRRCWQPLQVQGRARRRAQASSGTSPARSPLPGPFATVRLRLTSSETEAAERPRSRATPRAEGLLFPSSRSIAACSDLVSLKYLFCFLSAMILSFPSRQAPDGLAFQIGFSNSAARVQLSSREKAKCSDQLSNQLGGFDTHQLHCVIHYLYHAAAVLVQ